LEKNLCVAKFATPNFIYFGILFQIRRKTRDILAGRRTGTLFLANGTEKCRIVASEKLMELSTFSLFFIFSAAANFVAVAQESSCSISVALSAKSGQGHVKYAEHMAMLMSEFSGSMPFPLKRNAFFNRGKKY
jgi:hypothetical protein